MKTLYTLLATFVLAATPMMSKAIQRNDETRESKTATLELYQKDIALKTKVKGFDKEEVNMSYVVTMDMTKVTIDGEEYEKFVDIGDITYWLDNPDYAAVNPSTGYPLVDIKNEGASLEVMQIMQFSNYEVSETGEIIAASEQLRTDANTNVATYDLPLLKTIK